MVEPAQYLTSSEENHGLTSTATILRLNQWTFHRAKGAIDAAIPL